MSELSDPKAAQLAGQLESLLNARAEPLNHLLLSSLRPPVGRFRLASSELGFKVSWRHDTDYVCPTSLHDELSEAISAVEKTNDKLPPVSITENLVVRLRAIIWRTVDSSTPYARQKVSLYALCFLYWQFWSRLKTKKVSDTGMHPVGLTSPAAYRRSLVQVLSLLLQEPQASVTHQLRRHQYYLYWNYARRLRHLRHINDKQSAFLWPEQNAYLAMNRDCSESRVLVTIHMGDFFGAFKCIADALGESRSVMSLRREGNAQPIKTLSPLHAQQHRVFMHGQDNPVKIIKALREGKQTLSVLFDLGKDFGETTTVIFFGRKASFVRGPAELAILGRAKIYPFVSFSSAGCDRIDMEPAIDTGILPGESLQQAVARITQNLVTLAERWIRRTPAQWKYLNRLPSYFIAEDVASCLDYVVQPNAVDPNAFDPSAVDPAQQRGCHAQ